MARAVALLLVFTLLSLSLSGCGSVFIVGTFNPSVSTISGLVVEVRATNIPGQDGTLILVTIVTFQQGPTFTSSTFCGNIVEQLRLNTFARVDFTPASTCSSIVTIFIG